MPRRYILNNIVEGCYLETVDGLLFSVKGHFHPEGLIIAYLRYIPDERGERRRRETSFKRLYSIYETNEILRKLYPQYLNYVKELGLVLQSVPVDRISKVYHPEERLKEIINEPKTDLEKTISCFASHLSDDSGVSINSFGISGSVLISLASFSSDIDLIVYGSEASRRVYYALKRIRRRGHWIQPYDEKTVEHVVKARWGRTNLDLKELKKIEIRKVLHGIVDGREYFIRLVKFPEEVETEVSSKPVGRVMLKGEVSSAEESIYTPCRYRLKDCNVEGNGNLKVLELLSFHGRFTEQVQEGDEVEAKGTLETVQYPDRIMKRVVLGEEDDYLIPLKCMKAMN
ncbi:MAG: hypothetical protein ACUVV4_05440 [Candidatus Bathyarchaeia archaeon]